MTETAWEAAFEHHRSHLLAVAYRILGTVTDAQDVVQDTWLRCSTADPAAVRDVRAWLTTTATRLAIDRLRADQVRRAAYIGPWLPEPLIDDPEGDPEAAGSRAEEVSMALLIALERLGPEERAALLLRDVFDRDYEEIAATLGKQPTACRQLVKRARDRVTAGEARFDANAAEHARLAHAFGHAAQSGDLAALRQILSDDVVLFSDGGGRVPALRRPVIGHTEVLRVLAGLARVQSGSMRMEPRLVNGRAGWLIHSADDLRTVVAFEAREGQICRLYLLRNPDKLRHVH